MSRKPSEKEIDRIVIAEAEDDSKWEPVIRVRRASALKNGKTPIATPKRRVSQLHKTSKIAK